MSGSQFGFLEAEFAEQFGMASWEERHALSSPGPAVIYARKTLESGVKWAFAHDPALELPYQDKLNAYLNSPAFNGLVGGRLFPIAKKIQRAGNRAVHESKPPTQLEAVEVISALFQFCFWLAFTYGRQVKPDPKLKFDPKQLSRVEEVEQRSLKERQALEARLERERKEAEAARNKAARLAGTVAEFEADRTRLIAQIAAAKESAASVAAEEHDWSEFETRAFKIDALLAEAGGSWPMRGTVSSRSPACRTHRAVGTSTMCCGVTTGCRWGWWRRSGAWCRRSRVSSRRSCTRTVSRSGSGSGR